ncbi:MAG: NAD-binding protein, partial [Actinomycetota bacterium]
SDATNVYITLTARSINPDLFIVARASERGTAERLERAGANRVVSPFVTSGRHMVRMALDPSIVDVFDETARSIPVAERLVAEGSDLEGTQVGAVGAILALRRVDGSTVAAPPSDTVIRAGDVVLLLGA